MPAPRLLMTRFGFSSWIQREMWIQYSGREAQPGAMSKNFLEDALSAGEVIVTNANVSKSLNAGGRAATGIEAAFTPADRSMKQRQRVTIRSSCLCILLKGRGPLSPTLFFSGTCRIAPRSMFEQSQGPVEGRKAHGGPEQPAPLAERCPDRRSELRWSV